MQLRFLSMLCMVCMCFTLSAQNQEKREQPVSEAQPLENALEWNSNLSHKTDGIQPFVAIKEIDQPVQGLERKLTMTLDREIMQDLYERNLPNIELAIPYFGGVLIELELHQYDLLTDDFRVVTSESNEEAVETPMGRYYRGSIKGQPLSTVAISVFEEEMIGMVTLDGENVVIHPGEGGDDYVVYNDQDLLREVPFTCDALDHPEQNDDELLYKDAPESSKCVEVYLECDHALYLNKGSRTNTVNWITAVFNNMATLYSNESITTAISEIFVWTTPDSYSTTSSYNALTAFRSLRSTYNGDLAHLAALGGRNLGGIAWLDVLCSSYGYAYSNINSTYSTVPTYSWTVEVMTHEMGHNLGSNHTQWCGWPGGAIDNCYATEGGCPRGPAPTGGGTIMSYCHLTGYGINFNNGFGTHPGNKIRAEVNGATCLGSCGGGGGGCDTPTGLSASNITTASATISWNSVSGASSYTLEYRRAGGSWSSVTTSGTSYNLTGLSSTTTYDTRVQATCSGTTGSFSGIVSFTTKGTSKYCTSKGNSSSREWISRVRTGTIDRSSGSDGGYYDATALSSNMTKGQYNLLYFQAGKTGGRRTFYWRVWLDLNQDGDFNDSGELRVSGRSSYTGLLYAWVYIPTSATNGSTRMRVSMRYGGYPGACQTFSRGEVEDYTIDIVNSGTLESGDTEVAMDDRFSVSPNPTQDNAFLNFELDQDSEVEVQILDQMGRSYSQVIHQGISGQNLMDLPTEELPAGHYFVQITYDNRTLLKRLVKR